MKLCKDCKHCVVENRECIHPNNFDVVTGVRDAKRCDDMRAPSGLCGVEGRWWFGKDVVDSKAEMIHFREGRGMHGTVPTLPDRF